ncbi:DNA topoisomerase IB [Pseudonocardia kujensis]|uniref:DNA topoisomerase IB n=1 Tax=Pseudonocardia kujensis TaxID=1128675 RepID=UPI001E32330F|nr:DNA topoisomerase IB [Pseudonocardia kujensis]MCE0762297.1 DNA topoisomerase IB [Pseudonocardia kujensis]
MTAAAVDPPAGLVRSDPAAPGYGRRRSGRGWVFLGPDGDRIDDRAEIARIKSLVIPPAWRDVWIAPDPRGHIQAVGTDDAGRRQYRYHDDWRRARDEEKHDRVLSLGRRLADIRGEITTRLEDSGLHRERVLAGAVRMLDIGVFRAGGEQYAPSCGDDGSDNCADGTGSAGCGHDGDDHDDSGTFGLATLRRDHVSLRRGLIHFDYPAKGGVPRKLDLRDPLLHRLVNGLLRRKGGGEDLLAYRTGRSSWHDVRSEDLNTAVKELAGEQFTCKDLRTWNATVLAAVTLAGAVAEEGRVPSAERARARMVRRAITTVSDHLGNTPTVAKNSYVDPRVVERFEEGRTVLVALQRLEVPDLTDDHSRAAVERAVVRLVTG